MAKIDAVSMVREIRDRQYEETKYLRGDELKKYYSEKAKLLNPALFPHPIPTLFSEKMRDFTGLHMVEHPD